MRIPWNLADEGAAVNVLRDGTTRVAWREIVSTRPDEPRWIDWNLDTSRFDPTGAPVGEPSPVHTFSHHQDSRNGRRLDAPAISHWPDGSYVVGWADVTLTPTGPNLLATIQARRYHATGWPVADPVTVSGSATSSQFALQALPYTGGYVVSYQGRPGGLSDQVIRLLDFWNPIDPACFSGLAVGSLLVPLGVCGNLRTASCTTRRSIFPMGRRCRSMMAVWWWRGYSPANRG